MLLLAAAPAVDAGDDDIDDAEDCEDNDRDGYDDDNDNEETEQNTKYISDNFGNIGGIWQEGGLRRPDSAPGVEAGARK